MNPSPSFFVMWRSDARPPHTLEMNIVRPFGAQPRTNLSVWWCLYSDQSCHWPDSELGFSHLSSVPSNTNRTNCRLENDFGRFASICSLVAHGIRPLQCVYMKLTHVLSIRDTVLRLTMNMSARCSCSRPSRNRKQTMKNSSIVRSFLTFPGFLACGLTGPFFKLRFSPAERHKRLLSIYHIL